MIITLRPENVYVYNSHCMLQIEYKNAPKLANTGYTEHTGPRSIHHHILRKFLEDNASNRNKTFQFRSLKNGNIYRGHCSLPAELQLTSVLSLLH